MITRSPTSDQAGAPSLLDRYIDGLLDTDEKAAFEKALAADTSLREQLALQCDMDAVLKRRFTPDVDGLRAARPAAKTHGQPLWFKLAAALLLALVGVYAYMLLNQPARTHPIDAYIAESKAFAPYVVCENDEQMLKFTRDNVGEGLLIQPAAGLSLVGWSYKNNVLSDDTVSLLAKAGDDKIIVYMDRAGRDRAITGLARDGVRVFKRQIGNVVLYEVTPREEPVVLAQVRKPP